MPGGPRPNSGGARPGAGRPRGSRTRPAAAKALLQATVIKKRKRLRAADVLYDQLAENVALRDQARKAGDPDLHRIYSQRVERIAQSLLPHEMPRLNAIAVAAPPSSQRTEFRFEIFERERQPPLIDARPVETSGRPEPSLTISDDRNGLGDAKNELNPTPAPQQAKQYPTPETHPPPVAEDPRAPLMDCNRPRSLFEHPAFAPTRFGSRH